jgi:hypothetical protein
MIVDPYDAQLARKLESITPGLSQDLKRLPEFAESVAQAAIRELLSCACQATHDRVVSLGKHNLTLLPPPWLAARLPSLIQAQLNLNDDWEFRRLLELLHEISPTSMQGGPPTTPRSARQPRIMHRVATDPCRDFKVNASAATEAIRLGT